MKTKLRFFILATFLCCLLTAKAQVSKYTLSNCMIAYNDALLQYDSLDNVILYHPNYTNTMKNTVFNGSSAGTAADSLSGTGFSIGFPFLYDGQYYDRFAVSTNSYIKFGKSSEGNFSILNERIKGSVFQDGYNQLRRNTISTFERTMADDTIKGIYKITYRLSGTPGNRNLQIKWSNLSPLGSITPRRNIYLRLLEKTGTILLTYYMDTIQYSKCVGTVPNMVCYSGLLPLTQAAVGLRGNQLNNDTSNLNIMKVAKGVNTWTTFTRGTLATDLCDIDQHLLPLRNYDEYGEAYTTCPYWYRWTPPSSALSKPASPYSYFIFRDTAYLNNNGYHYTKIPVDNTLGNTYGFIDKYIGNTYVFANGAKAIPINKDTLHWNKAIGVDSFDVYFGLTYPPALVKKNITDTIYTPTETLLPSTTYYYSIVAKNAKGNSNKYIGSFTTNSTIYELCPLPDANINEEHPGTWYAFSLNTLSYTPTSKYYYTFYMPEGVYTTSLKRGQTYTFSYTNKSIYNYAGYAYIDWNQDGDFTDSEEKYAIGNITVPTSAKLGKTNLRICAYGTQASGGVTPCGGIDQLPLQQYIITVLPVEACSGFSLSYSETNTTCYGDSTGTISLAPVGGIKPYSCKWTDGNTSLVRTELPAGAYQATVTDSAGCDQTVKLAVLSPFLVQIDTATVGDSLTITVSGGTGKTYTYTWTKNNTVVSKSTTISIPTSGSYSLTITDSVGCSVTYTNIVVPVKKPNGIAIVKSAGQNLTVYPNPTTGDITISATDRINNIVIINVSGKQVSTKNNININTTNMNISGLPTGVYLVKAYTVSGIETREVIKK